MNRGQEKEQAMPTRRIFLLGTVLALALPALSCGPGVDACIEDLADCEGGVCLAGECEPLDGDADFDGLLNGTEIGLGSDPLNWDTDGDGLPDLDEVGPDPSDPLDSDGDKKPDILESADLDRDQDCVSDQLDPDDDDPDPEADLVTLDNCSRKGVCAAAFGLIVSFCKAGVAICDYSEVPWWQADETVCDGLDNDCDGDVDEGFTLGGIPVGFKCDGTGSCGVGVVECVQDGQSTQCSTEPGGSMDEASLEVCDGLDNDCDGQTDNGLDLGGVAVGGNCNGTGECGEGIVECGPGGLPICSTDPGGSQDQSSAEICNGLDDDCDSITDNDAEVSGSVADHCVPKGICATHIGKARLVCQGGETVCDFSEVPGYSSDNETVCKGEDDDCDGFVDEDFWMLDPVGGKVSVGEPCGTGACIGGTVVCATSGIHATCSSLTMSTPEACNGMDDDCDGTNDNGWGKVFDADPVLESEGEPSPRANSALAFHPPSNSMFVYGGTGRMSKSGTPEKVLSDFWRFDLQTHKFQSLGDAVPGPRTGASLLYDPAGTRLLLAGGLADDAAEEPVWAYRLDDGKWAELPVSIPQGGTLGASVDPVSWSLVLVRLDSDSSQDKMVRVSLETLEVETIDVDIPYRRDSATAFDPETGMLFVSGGRNEYGIPVSDLFTIEMNGDAWLVGLDEDLPALARHAITMLSDGSIVLFGGIDGSGTANSEAYRVRPGSGQVDTIPSPAIPGLQMPAMCSNGLEAFLYSGMDDMGHGLRQVLRFDADAAQWKSDLLEVAPSGRTLGTMVVLGTKKTAYLIGGFMEDIAGPRALMDVWSLSLVSGAFKQIPTEGESTGFINSASAADEASEEIYIHGGFTGPPEEGGEVTSKFFKFDPEVPIMTNLSGQSGPGPRYGHTLVWTGSSGSLLLYGGENGGDTLGDVWSYSTDAGWADLKALPHPRSGHASFWDPVSKGMIAVGGTPQGSLSFFNPVYRTWSMLADHESLAQPGAAVFFDAESRSVLFVPADGTGSALEMTLSDVGDVSIEQLELEPAPLVTGSLHSYDPFARRALLFGGEYPGGSTVSEMWVITQSCSK